MRGMGILLQLCGGFHILIVLKLQWREFLLQPLEDDKQCGNDEDLDESTNQHTSHGGGTEGLVTVLAYA